MRQFLTLFVPAYGVTLVAIPVAMTLDHLGRGATPLRALATLPLWLLYTAPFALPFVLLASGVALLLLRLGGEWWRSRAGRLLFTLVCAGLGAAFMMLTIRNYALPAAASGAAAAWVACSPAWPPGWRHALVVSAGLAAGIMLGLQFY